MYKYQKNRLIILILISLSVLMGWSIYLTDKQLDERSKLEKLDVHIQYYTYISDIIHTLQIERKAQVIHSLNLSGFKDENLQKYSDNTDKNIDTCMKYIQKHKIEVSNKFNRLKLIEIRNNKQFNNFEICEGYTSLIAFFRTKLGAVYKLNLPHDIKSKLMIYLILSSMHESMVQIDQAVSIAAMKKKFINREHYRFFHNALKTANIRKNDFLLVATHEEIKTLENKQHSNAHKVIHRIHKQLLNLTPEDTINIDLNEWNIAFEAVNEMQIYLERNTLTDLKKMANNYIQKLNKEIYFYIGLNSLVALLIISSFLLILYLYNNLLKQKSRLNIFAKAVENSDNNIIVTDLDHNITYVNEAFEKISGYSKDEIIGETPRFLQSGEHDQAYYAEINRVISLGETWFGEFINKRKDGTLFYEKASISPLVNDDNEMEGYIALKLDITKEREYQKMIEQSNLESHYRLYNDSLTDLPNRNQFIEDLNTRVHPIVILSNINDFKQINSYYGIHVGDIVLQQIAKLYSTIASEYNFKVYRMHSDEFAFLIDQRLSHSELEDILFYVNTRVLEFKFGPKELQLLLYTSLGVAQHNEEFGQENKLLLENADIALKFAKTSNENHAYYEEAKSLVKTFENNLLMTRKIADAINSERIIARFQPIVDEKGEIVLYEALVRMRDENGEIFYPDSFLNIAKHSKLYTKITRIMVKRVCEIFANRKESVSVNISYEDIVDERTSNYIFKLIEQYKIADRLTFEILESESIQNYDDIRKFIAIVKAKGCSISIDDFGSGYSNFERILKLDIDYIKIDGSIIKSITTDENSLVVAETIVHFAKKSNLKLVAEYVCDEEVNEAVLKLGIDYRQGYYIGKPKEIDT